MPTISFDVPASLVPRLSATAKWSLVNVYEMDISGFTDVECTRKWTKLLWQEGVGTYEGAQAGKTAREDAEQDMEAIS